MSSQPGSPTPPSTAPTSPRSPTSTDGFIDCEKGNSPDPINEKAIDVEEIGVVKTRTQDQNPPRRLSRYWQGLTSSKRSPHNSSKHRNVDGRPKLVQRIDDHPEGYPQLAAWINCDDNFLIARKYGFLRTRVLLYRQDELAVLERQLIRLDDYHSENQPEVLKSRKLDDTDKDPNYSRKVLIQKIDDKLKEYDDLISRVKTFVSLKTPSGRDTQSLFNFMLARKPLTIEESKFLEHKDDFVALAGGQESGWLDGVVEDTMTWCLPSNLMRKCFTSTDQTKRTDDSHTQLYSKRRIDIVVRLVLVLVTAGLLVGPSAVLFLVEGQSILKICLILVFTLLFAAAMSVCTKARRHEMLAATATYAAVLVVFLGNVNPTGLSS